MFRLEPGLFPVQVCHFFSFILSFLFLTLFSLSYSLFSFLLSFLFLLSLLFVTLFFLFSFLFSFFFLTLFSLSYSLFSLLLSFLFITLFSLSYSISRVTFQSSKHSCLIWNPFKLRSTEILHRYLIQIWNRNNTILHRYLDIIWVVYAFILSPIQ